METLLFPFCSVPSGTHKTSKRAVSFSSGSQEGEDGSARDPVSTLPSPSPFASGQQGPVRGRNAFSRTPAQSWSQVSVAPHRQTPLRDALPFESGPCSPLRCPTAGTSVTPLVPAFSVSGGLARSPQAFSLALEDHQTQLRDSVHPASSQVQGHSVHHSVKQGCPCLACRSHGPAGEGRNRAGPSSRDEIRVLQPLFHRTQERRWVTTNLGPAHSASVLSISLQQLT